MVKRKKKPVSGTRKRRLSGPTGITSMRMPPKLMALADQKAASIGMYRSQYIEVLVRRDLGLEGVDLEAPIASVFG